MFGLVAAGFLLLAPMKSADLRLIASTSFELCKLLRFGKSRSYLICHHTQNACATFDDLSCVRVDLLRCTYGHAAAALTYPLSYLRSCASTAQIVRAILLASATVTTFGGRRLRICSTHAPDSFACARTLRAP